MTKIQWVDLSFGVLVVFELRVVFDLEAVEEVRKTMRKTVRTIRDRKRALLLLKERLIFGKISSRDETGDRLSRVIRSRLTS